MPPVSYSYSWRGAIYERRGEWNRLLVIIKKIKFTGRSSVDKFNLRNIEHLIRVTEGLTRLEWINLTYSKI